MSGLAVATCAAGAWPAAAAPPDALRELERQARQANAGFAGFSAPAGAAFFRDAGTDLRCTSCHGEDPRRPGRHVVTGKTVAPMAPSVNSERLSDPARTEKWFRRNCKDVLGRECTLAEKGDVAAWLASLKPSVTP